MQNTGAITANGGNGGNTGGTGATISMQGTAVNNSVALTCQGGTGGTGQGGGGGSIFLNAAPNGPTVNSGTLSVAAGASSHGNFGSGTIVIDGVTEGP